jgi:short-subunit dehydrogenase
MLPGESPESEFAEDSMGSSVRPLAIVTGGSSGIGFELARECVENGFDVVIAADTPTNEAVSDLQALGGKVLAVNADLATRGGVDELLKAIAGREPDVLIANAGHGLGKGFLDQKFEEITHVIDTNITGTLYLIHEVGRGMRSRGRGRILITGSIAGFMPGTFQAVYNGTKAFIDSFSWALRNELKDTGVTVTCLMPGVTDTEFFARADLMDTKVGTQENKADPAEVARIGFKAMMDGEGDVVAGLKNKLQTAMASVTPASVLAEQHRKMAEPGTADKRRN